MPYLLAIDFGTLNVFQDVKPDKVFQDVRLHNFYTPVK